MPRGSLDLPANFRDFGKRRGFGAMAQSFDGCVRHRLLGTPEIRAISDD